MERKEDQVEDSAVANDGNQGRGSTTPIRMIRRQGASHDVEDAGRNQQQNIPVPSPTGSLRSDYNCTNNNNEINRSMHSLSSHPIEGNEGNGGGAVNTSSCHNNTSSPRDYEMMSSFDAGSLTGPCLNLNLDDGGQQNPTNYVAARRGSRSSPPVGESSSSSGTIIRRKGEMRTRKDQNEVPPTVTTTSYDSSRLTSQTATRGFPALSTYTGTASSDSNVDNDEFRHVPVDTNELGASLPMHPPSTSDIRTFLHNSNPAAAVTGASSSFHHYSGVNLSRDQSLARPFASGRVNASANANADANANINANPHANNPSAFNSISRSAQVGAQTNQAQAQAQAISMLQQHEQHQQQMANFLSTNLSSQSLYNQAIQQGQHDHLTALRGLPHPYSSNLDTAGFNNTPFSSQNNVTAVGSNGTNAHNEPERNRNRNNEVGEQRDPKRQKPSSSQQQQESSQLQQQQQQQQQQPYNNIAVVSSQHQLFPTAPTDVLNPATIYPSLLLMQEQEQQRQLQHEYQVQMIRRDYEFLSQQNAMAQLHARAQINALHQVMPEDVPHQYVSMNSADLDMPISVSIDRNKKLDGDQNQSLEHHTEREVKTLGTEGDSIWLSEFLCFLRAKCCEVFTATSSDVLERRKTKQVNLNQVGIRCRFCAHLPHGERSGRSSCFPSSVDRIYQSVTMMIREHFPICEAFPADVRERYIQLKQHTKKGEMESKTHWKNAAEEMGMCGTEKGIYFEDQIPDHVLRK